MRMAPVPWLFVAFFFLRRKLNLKTILLQDTSTNGAQMEYLCQQFEAQQERVMFSHGRCEEADSRWRRARARCPVLLEAIHGDTKLELTAWPFRKPLTRAHAFERRKALCLRSASKETRSKASINLSHPGLGTGLWDGERALVWELLVRSHCRLLALGFWSVGIQVPVVPWSPPSCRGEDTGRNIALCVCPREAWHL